MGGKGSGGWNRLSDEEKKKRGTFRADQSDSVWNERGASKIVTGVFQSAIPDPSIPLKGEGKKKYIELATLLLNGGKLTSITALMCEQVASLHQKQCNMIANGKDPPVSLINRMIAILKDLRVADDAAAVPSPNQKNRFQGSGFSNSRNSPYRLRPHSGSDSSEL